MYCLMSGEVVVEQDGDQLGFLPEGSFFGESALIDTGEGSEIRTRTIKAMTECAAPVSPRISAFCVR
eukprot:COSAG04_NODE_1769_length_5627_cov_1.496201_4_plen_67_part_00